MLMHFPEPPAFTNAAAANLLTIIGSVCNMMPLRREQSRSRLSCSVPHRIIAALKGSTGAAAPPPRCCGDLDLFQHCEISVVCPTPLVNYINVKLDVLQNAGKYDTASPLWLCAQSIWGWQALFHMNGRSFPITQGNDVCKYPYRHSLEYFR